MGDVVAKKIGTESSSTAFQRYAPLAGSAVAVCVILFRAFGKGEVAEIVAGQSDQIVEVVLGLAGALAAGYGLIRKGQSIVAEKQAGQEQGQ